MTKFGSFLVEAIYFNLSFRLGTFKHTSCYSIILWTLSFVHRRTFCCRPCWLLVSVYFFFICRNNRIPHDRLHVISRVFWLLLFFSCSTATKLGVRSSFCSAWVWWKRMNVNISLSYTKHSLIAPETKRWLKHFDIVDNQQNIQCEAHSHMLFGCRLKIALLGQLHHGHSWIFAYGFSGSDATHLLLHEHNSNRAWDRDKIPEKKLVSVCSFAYQNDETAHNLWIRINWCDFMQSEQTFFQFHVSLEFYSYFMVFEEARLQNSLPLTDRRRRTLYTHSEPSRGNTRCVCVCVFLFAVRINVIKADKVIIWLTQTTVWFVATVAKNRIEAAEQYHFIFVETKVRGLSAVCQMSNRLFLVPLTFPRSTHFSLFHSHRSYELSSHAIILWTGSQSIHCRQLADCIFNDNVTSTIYSKPMAFPLRWS